MYHLYFYFAHVSLVLLHPVWYVCIYYLTLITHGYHHCIICISIFHTLVSFFYNQSVVVVSIICSEEPLVSTIVSFLFSHVSLLLLQPVCYVCIYYLPRITLSNHHCIICISFSLMLVFLLLQPVYYVCIYHLPRRTLSYHHCIISIFSC